MSYLRRLQLWEAVANNPTYERRRAEHQGFRFGRILVEPNLSVFVCDQRTILLRGNFICVCGREEYFVRKIAEVPEPTERDLDSALWLRNYGSFSRSHLLADGYSKEDVQRIERLGQEFDAMHGLHTTLMPWPDEETGWYRQDVNLATNLNELDRKETS